MAKIPSQRGGKSPFGGSGHFDSRYNSMQRGGKPSKGGGGTGKKAGGGCAVLAIGFIVAFTAAGGAAWQVFS